MPSSVKAEGSLCAQIAAIASLRVSINFTVNYSQRRASIGFKRAAFHAGHKPNTIPTAAEIPTPTAIAHKGTYAGKGEYSFIKKLAISPTANPANPPMAVNTKIGRAHA